MTLVCDQEEAWADPNYSIQSCAYESVEAVKCKSLCVLQVSRKKRGENSFCSIADQSKDWLRATIAKTKLCFFSFSDFWRGEKE